MLWLKSGHTRVIHLLNQDDRMNMTEIGEHDQKIDNDERTKNEKINY